MSFNKGDKKIINAWCWFDWANSVYPLVITTAVFPIYFTEVTTTPTSSTISILGIDFDNSVFYSYLIAFSFLIVAFLSPLLSGIADYAGRKKRFMQFFSTLGALSSCALFFFTGLENLWIGVLFSITASIGFAGSLVFYNAFLPEIAEEEQLDMVSAKGFTMGYIGSSIMLIFCLAMIMFPASFGLSDAGFATRLAFLLAGVWWVGFARITFSRLPSNIHNRQPVTRGLLSKGYQELMQVFGQLRQPENKKIRLFLIGFFFYAFGYMTVIYLASIFGSEELGLPADKLIAVILIIQFVAIGGSYLFAWLSGKIGNVRAIMIAVIIWALVCGSTWFVTDFTGFCIVAFFVGTVMGGVQALSRSTYAKLLPETEDHASYYSFYEFAEKVATAAGTFSFGAIILMTGSMRNSTIFLGTMFLVGLVFLVFVDREVQKEAAAKA